MKARSQQHNSRSLALSTNNNRYFVSALILVTSFVGCFLAKAYITADVEANVECASLFDAATKQDAAKQWLLYQTSLDQAEADLAGQNQSSLILPGTPNLLRCYCTNASASLFASFDDTQESFEQELRAAAEELDIEFDTITDFFLCEQLCVRACVRCGAPRVLIH